MALYKRPYAIPLWEIALPGNELGIMTEILNDAYDNRDELRIFFDMIEIQSTMTSYRIVSKTEPSMILDYRFTKNEMKESVLTIFRHLLKYNKTLSQELQIFSGSRTERQQKFLSFLKRPEGPWWRDSLSISSTEQMYERAEKLLKGFRTVRKPSSSTGTLEDLVQLRNPEKIDRLNQDPESQGYVEDIQFAITLEKFRKETNLTVLEQFQREISSQASLKDATQLTLCQKTIEERMKELQSAEVNKETSFEKLLGFHQKNLGLWLQHVIEQRMIVLLVDPSSNIDVSILHPMINENKFSESLRNIISLKLQTIESKKLVSQLVNSPQNQHKETIDKLAQIFSIETPEKKSQPQEPPKSESPRDSEQPHLLFSSANFFLNIKLLSRTNSSALLTQIQTFNQKIPKGWKPLPTTKSEETSRLMAGFIQNSVDEVKGIFLFRYNSQKEIEIPYLVFSNILQLNEVLESIFDKLNIFEQCRLSQKEEKNLNLLSSIPIVFHFSFIEEDAKSEEILKKMNCILESSSPRSWKLPLSLPISAATTFQQLNEHRVFSATFGSAGIYWENNS